MNEKILTFLKARLDRGAGDWKSRRQEQSPPSRTNSTRVGGFRFCSCGFNRPIAIPLSTLLLTAVAAPGNSTPASPTISPIFATLDMGQPQTRELQIARRTVRRRPGDKTSPSRGIGDSNLPYLIGPRNTAILNRQPLLRWNPIPGATSYRVKVFRHRMKWETEVGETQVVYTGEPLQPGKRYWVTITADNGISTQGKDSVTFDVLTDDKAQQVEAELGRLEGQPLTEETAFEWVDVYTQNGLYADAIEVLENQIRSENRSLNVYGALGDLYRWVGLDGLSLAHYEAALQLAGNSEDEEELLGRIEDLKSRLP